MRAVVQRVSRSEVRVADRLVAIGGPGLLVLLGIHVDDTEQDAARLAHRLGHLRLMADADGKMNLSLLDQKQQGVASLVTVPNFTVYGDASGQRRPSFVMSAPFDRAKFLFEFFLHSISSLGIKAVSGEFGADMQVELVNDGPVTLIVDEPNSRR